MGCEVIRDTNGKMTMMVCTRNRKPAPPCRFCGRSSTQLCDFPLRGSKKGRTCDAPLCNACAVSVGPNSDLCPVHAREWKA